MEIFDHLDFNGIFLMTVGTLCMGLIIAAVWIIRDNNRLKRTQKYRDYQLFMIEHDAKKVRDAENDEYYKRFGR